MLFRSDVDTAVFDDTAIKLWNPRMRECRKQPRLDGTALECVERPVGIEWQDDFFDGVAPVTTFVDCLENNRLTAGFDDARQVVAVIAIHKSEF